MKISFIRFKIFVPIIAAFLLFSTGFAQKDSAKSRQLLVFPIITESIETGWSFGTIGALVFRPSAKDTISRTSNLELIGLYSTKKQLVAVLNGSQYFHNEKYILNEQFSFSSFPDKFWGLGKNSPDTAVEPYKFKQTYVYLHLLRKVANKLFIGVLYEKQNVWDISYVPGGLFDKQQVVGRQGYQVDGLGTSLTYDSRNNAFEPGKGFFGQLYFNHFDKFWGSYYNYDNLMIDLKAYLPVGYKKVLALELFSFNNTGNEVPLRSLASFGGASRMRGYYEGRYKDQNQLVLQAEYRFPIYKRFRGVVFGGGGDVGGSFTDYSFSDLKYSYGAGLRFALSQKEKLNLRIDYGIGQGNNSGFYIQLGEAF
jgi:outer membrane protein assembly factor BamA